MNFRILLETQAQAKVLKEKLRDAGYWGTANTQTISYENLNAWLDEQILLKTPQMRPMTAKEIFELWQSNGFRLVVRFLSDVVETIIGYDGRFDLCFKFGNGIYNYNAILEWEYTIDNGATWHKFETEVK